MNSIIGSDFKLEYIQFDSLPFLNIDHTKTINLVISGPDNKTRFFEFIEDMDKMTYAGLAYNILIKMGLPFSAYERIGIVVGSKHRGLTDFVKDDAEELKTIRLFWKAC